MPEIQRWEAGQQHSESFRGKDGEGPRPQASVKDWVDILFNNLIVFLNVELYSLRNTQECI